ncbi:MAG: hypothetical protein HYZ47_00145, partial [Simkania negevensis]|nr:hypothetical protein [Simkania negevensis]
MKVGPEILTGDFFGSDRIDYLLRDAKNTGLAYGLFDYHQLLEMLKILPDQKGGFALGIEENGIESCEALLLSRYYMHKRLYQYASVKAYGFHLSRFMAKIYPDLGKKDLNYYLSMTDNEILTELRKAAYDPSHPGYADAFCLTLRKNRYRAIPLSSSLSPEDLFQIKEECKGEEIAF